MSRKTQKVVVYLMIGVMLITTLLAGVSVWF
ncbi:stressosome-associated protein Prli42 [Metabacillus halosaccharovorans]|uniref:Stressosome-associated protein Prli42 n=1 Tax=Metabacillus halosaccharovorans TaxID=930124 RepID=A0ABT3DMY8_9BACI|nr:MULTISPECIES: stressosome-associated protein Prli42 [Bacillaceae]MCM3440922.1 stressosome-associated protein Prli42 [Metabacillus halosaccharovorans]MCV9888226.1 stressosome-associated protein Prli42 [Metabacillus halosaccharovorans]